MCNRRQYCSGRVANLLSFVTLWAGGCQAQIWGATSLPAPRDEDLGVGGLRPPKICRRGQSMF